jgi:elongation factor Ts
VAAVEISAKAVMTLRAQTGLPMMKCKEALEATGGDVVQAVEWLRKKGLETAAKKADRAMKEGRVAIHAAADGRSAAMLEVDCETEPVREGPDFRALVDGVLAVVVSGGPAAADAAGNVPLDWLLAQPFGTGGDTVDVTVKHLVAKIGENMAVRRAAALSGGRVGTYLHFNAKVGVVAELEGSPAALSSADATSFLADLGKHVAFAKPAAVSRDQVDRAAVEKELEIYRGQAKEDPKMAGKPAAVVEKIVGGKLDKFFAERCLLEQPWVMDDKQTVKAVLEGVSKKAGGPIAVRRFALFQVGGA